MTAPSLAACLGALVHDRRTGFAGVLMDVVSRCADPARRAAPADTAFIRPRGGGRERAVDPALVCVLGDGRAQGCRHLEIVRRNGKTYCASCAAQIYL